MGQRCLTGITTTYSLSKLLMLDNLRMYVDENGRRKVMTKVIVCDHATERGSPEEVDTPITKIVYFHISRIGSSVAHHLFRQDKTPSVPIFQILVAYTSLLQVYWHRYVCRCSRMGLLHLLAFAGGIAAFLFVTLSLGEYMMV